MVRTGLEMLNADLEIPGTFQQATITSTRCLAHRAL